MTVNVGDTIYLTDDAVDNYGDRWRGEPLRVTHVARSVDEHPGYDTAVGGEALVDTEVVRTGECVPFSVYEYEFELG
ncbi:hypothetical protein H7J07_05330 [Mycobacterium koreense]|uniref:Uncharacterized protein n=1 Tax=Mycolicibacillus koreensis TaxID=1069220 RepID=A0A7I7SCM0_9MYCO|nr:hypothetical protein [Mycolicibacillus koreensis]MCV7247646.1 hypothetical protein [Mycolicibacillus koreensis]OSC30606.1 hypothetical protein B8W67_16855 [Mycolicibacillus koreensis]BBY54029.1 hypothetical protein MKOR_12800 [Mycolicibacillus koreensis]